jgi:hypothetical protein
MNGRSVVRILYSAFYIPQHFIFLSILYSI